MFEDQTYDIILQRMLSKAPPEVDIREGSILFDTCASAAMEVFLLYAALDYFFKNTFADTAERKFLIERAMERGMSPNEATRAVIKVETAPSNIELSLGTLFQIGSTIFEITGKSPDGLNYLATCTSSGVAGNLREGSLTSLSQIEGLQSAKILSLEIPAKNEETTDAFRKRYFESFENLAYGGNIADYKEWCNNFSGVGATKVFPHWQGGGTCLIVICNNQFEAPSSTLISNLQEYLDPVPNQQKGLGKAPIGHLVTVRGATSKKVKISLSVQKIASSTVAKETLIAQIQNTALNYLKGLNLNWGLQKDFTSQDGVGLICRKTALESALLTLPDIEDLQILSINDENKNFSLKEVEIFNTENVEVTLVE